MIPAWPNTPGYRWRGPDGSQGSTGTSAVALTFDDGPGPYTSQVLDLLDKYHVKATFCLIGRQIHAYRAVVKRMIDDGMTLCNHSWDHDESIGKHTAPYIAANLQRMINAVHAVDPTADVTYYRNPGGNFTPGTVRVSELLGMRPLYWSEDTDDWTRPGVAAIEHMPADQDAPRLDRADARRRRRPVRDAGGAAGVIAADGHEIPPDRAVDRPHGAGETGQSGTADLTAGHAAGRRIGAAVDGSAWLDDVVCDIRMPFAT